MSFVFWFILHLNQHSQHFGKREGPWSSPAKDGGENALMANFTGELKLMILVPDREMNLNGEYLAVLGDDAIGNWREYLPFGTPNEGRDRITFVYGDATATPRWNGIQLNAFCYAFCNC